LFSLLDVLSEFTTRCSGLEWLDRWLLALCECGLQIPHMGLFLLFRQFRLQVYHLTMDTVDTLLQCLFLHQCGFQPTSDAPFEVQFRLDPFRPTILLVLSWCAAAVRVARKAPAAVRVARRVPAGVPVVHVLVLKWLNARVELSPSGGRCDRVIRFQFFF
jgi:hypothetical protein